MKNFLSIGLISLLLFLGGCIPKKSKEVKKIQLSNVYFSSNEGEVFTPLEVFREKSEDIPKGLVSHINFSPLDSRYIYIATNKGIWYSFPKEGFSPGSYWKLISKEIGIRGSKNLITSVAIDPLDPSRVYFSGIIRKYSRIYKLVEFKPDSQKWKEIFSEPDPKIVITDLEIIKNKPNIIIAASTSGNIYKSENYGEDWTLLYRFNFSIFDLAIDPSGNMILAATKKGVFKSEDGGKSFTLISSSIAKEELEINSIRIFPTNPNIFYFSTEKAIFVSFDRGKSFEKVTQLFSLKGVPILTFALDPKDFTKLYFSTESVLYKARKSGKKWIFKPLLSDKKVVAIAVDHYNPKKIYIGIR